MSSLSSSHLINAGEAQSHVSKLLGMDHEKLTYHYNGRDFRLTDVTGVVAKEIIV